MKQTKNLILGALSCLLLAVGFAQAGQVGESKNNLPSGLSISPMELARAPIGPVGPGDDGPSAGVV